MTTLGRTNEPPWLEVFGLLAALVVVAATVATCTGHAADQRYALACAEKGGTYLKHAQERLCLKQGTVIEVKQ